jgi:tetratricopeptide (TPR) repeat protein
VLPVVSRRDVHDLLGVVALGDIPRAYSREGEPESTSESAHVERASPRTLLGIVVAGVLGLFFLGGLLVNHYYSERSARAQHAYASGQELFAQHRDAEAIESFRTALSLVHDDQYRLALGLSLARAGREAEARVYLGQVLRDQPDNPLANLALARLEVGLGDVPGATRTYRRAVSAGWPVGLEGERTAAVFELVALLERTGAARQAEAELLRQSERVHSPDGLERVARALLRLGSTKQAADIFREAIAAAPQAVAGFLWLGDALLAQGGVREAAATFDEAARVEPGNDLAAAKRALCAAVLALDPTLSGLSRRERYERSRRLLAAVMAGVEACDGEQVAPGAVDVLRRARGAADRRRPPTDPSAALDENLQLASAIWGMKRAGCPAFASGGAVERVMAHLRS